MDIGTLENARKLKILEGEQQVSGGWNLAREPNMEDSPYRLFKAPRYPYDDIEDYRGQPAFGVEEGGQMFFTFPFVQNFDDSPDMKRQKNMLEGDALEEGIQNPETNDMMIAHHTGGKHFTEPSMDELIQGLIDGQVPAGTLGDPETEQRMIEEYQKTKQNKLVSWVKNVGDELTPQEVMDGLRIIDQTETNPLKKRRRLDRMMDNNPPKA